MECLTRDFPRLAGQEVLLKAMIDVYNDHPGYLQHLTRRLEKEKGKTSGKTPPPAQLYADGEVVGAVQIISRPEVNQTNADADADATSDVPASQKSDRLASEEPDAVPAQPSE